MPFSVGVEPRAGGLEGGAGSDTGEDVRHAPPLRPVQRDVVRGDQGQAQPMRQRDAGRERVAHFAVVAAP